MGMEVGRGKGLAVVCFCIIGRHWQRIHTHASPVESSLLVDRRQSRFPNSKGVRSKKKLEILVF